MEEKESNYSQQVQETNPPSTKILTGSHDLNKWLEGGYEKGIITLFYGPSASGKSNFITLTACHQAKNNKKIIFIDTEGSFSVERVNQISQDPEINKKILKNIIILKPTNFQEQKKSFFTMLKELKESKNIGLIIVDSITMLYRLELAEARKKSPEDVRDINNDLATQVKALHEIARKRNIPVLITAQVYNEFLSEEEWLKGKEAGVNLVGGDILKYWSKCLIELQNKNQKKKAIIRKHRSLPEKELNFEIINEGIRKRGWL
jgi:DNA repair protein RadB